MNERLRQGTALLGFSGLVCSGGAAKEEETIDLEQRQECWGARGDNAVKRRIGGQKWHGENESVRDGRERLMWDRRSERDSEGRYESGGGDERIETKCKSQGRPAAVAGEGRSGVVSWMQWRAGQPNG